MFKYRGQMGLISPYFLSNWLYADLFRYDANDLNFRVTATHEIGHALGLSHSSDRSAIMFSAYSVFRPDQMLPIDVNDANKL